MSIWRTCKRDQNKTDRINSRARASPLIKWAEKKLGEVLNQFDDEDTAAAVGVLRKQLKATKEIWDVNAKCMVKIPDEKIRQDAALAILAYKWGRPTEKKLVASGKVEDLAALQARIQGTSIGASLQKTVEGKEVAPTLPQSQKENTRTLWAHPPCSRGPGKR